jgi:hypothetical protein
MNNYVYEVINIGKGQMIKRTDQKELVAWIPTDPGNADYQRYLRWLENPEADETTPIIEVTQ